MTRPQTQQTQPIAADPVATEPADFPLSLDEFCARLSAKDRRVALIGGFHHHAKQTGLTKAREAEFAQAWNAFICAPA